MEGEGMSPEQGVLGTAGLIELEAAAIATMLAVLEGTCQVLEEEMAVEATMAGLREPRDKEASSISLAQHSDSGQ
jgi:hypothetical protein